MAARRELSQRGADLGIRPQVDGSAVLGEAPECGPPVADAALGPDIEQLGRLSAILRQRGRIQRRDRMKAPRRVREPVVPKRPSVAEHVELDRDRPHETCPVSDAGRGRRRPLTRKIPITRPTVSMRTSIGDAWRPRTKCWWNSSVTA